MDGDVIGLAWHKVEVDPGWAELAIGEDAAQTACHGVIELYLILESLVDDGHTGHVGIVALTAELGVGVGDIDIVERIFDIGIYTALDTEGFLWRIHLLGVEVGT